MINLLMGAAMLIAPIAFTPTGKRTNSADDAINAALDRQADGWNQGNGAVFAQDFTPDARFINVRGDLVVGREAIIKAHNFILNGPYKGSHLRVEVDSITYPASTVAIVDVLLTVTNFKTLPPGLVPTEPDAMRTRMKFVFVEQGGEWKIAAGQNTIISPVKMDLK